MMADDESKKSNPNATNWFAKRLFGDDPAPVV